MAEYFGLGADEPDEQSEKIVADFLRRLPNPWIILHHVSWQGVRGARQGDGEADFIVLHPQRGAIVIEVKGGGIHLDKGRWQTTDRFGHVYAIKNPYEQAVASKHALVEWLKRFTFNSRIRVGHAVAFPHHAQLPSLGPVAPPEISFSLTELSDIENSILRCVRHWQCSANLSASETQILTSSLAPTVEVKRKLFNSSNQAEERILTLTAEQVAIFSGLRAARGGLVLGSAGTGKTVLAVARAQQLARDGFRTLLVCYNELLGEQLAKSLDNTPNLTTSTYHGLCMGAARKAKRSIPTELTESWWENEAPDLLLTSSGNSEDGYDAVVVDEGQDFSPLWLDSLRLVLNSGKASPFFVFADPRQDIWKRQWRDDEDYPFSWELTLNLRNTEPIARKVSAIAGFDCVPTGVTGPKPEWRCPVGDKVEEGDVLDTLQRLIDEGFRPGSLVILTNSPKTCGRLRDRTAGSFSLGKWGGKGFSVETIRRFKGLESQGILLVLEQCDMEEARLLAYIGTSRARSVLSVVGSAEFKKEFSWQ